MGELGEAVAEAGPTLQDALLLEERLVLNGELELLPPREQGRVHGLYAVLAYAPHVELAVGDGPFRPGREAQSHTMPLEPDDDGVPVRGENA